MSAFHPKRTLQPSVRLRPIADIDRLPDEWRMTFRVVGLVLAATAMGACGPSNAVPGCKDPAYERPSGFFELEATVFRGEADWSVFNERCKERLLAVCRRCRG